MVCGFIGAGNMGGALARAVSKKYDVLLSDYDSIKAISLAGEIGAKASCNEEVVRNAEYIFLGVKPQVLQSVIDEIKDLLKNRTDSYTVISMAAGVEIKKLEEMLGFRCPIIRIMPNTPAAIGHGMILYTANGLVSDPTVIEDILSHAGKLDRIDEKLIDAASALSGCGPAFVYMFAQSLADGAVECGLSRSKATEYAAQTIIGAAKMVQESGKHPIELKDAVCSPGGSTIAGVHALEDGAFGSDVMNAVVKAFIKTKELGK